MMSNPNQKKVLLLFCGGTIVMEERADGSLNVPADRESAIEILTSIEPKLSSIAPYDIEFIANLDSTNLVPADWDKLLAAIKKHYQHYAGFVITHGTDTMAYTAAALNLALWGWGNRWFSPAVKSPAIKLKAMPAAIW